MQRVQAEVDQDIVRERHGAVQKLFATAVGLDPAALAAAYDAQRGNSRPVSAPVAPVEQPTAVSDLSSATDSLGALAGSIGASVAAGRKGPNWSAVMALALAVIGGRP